MKIKIPGSDSRHITNVDGIPLLVLAIVVLLNDTVSTIYVG